jgi:phage recombination protein Bet
MMSCYVSFFRRGADAVPVFNAFQSNFSKIEQIDLMEHLIKKKINQCSTQMNIEETELMTWIEEISTSNPNLSRRTILHLLRHAKEHHLNPLQQEISLINFDDKWEVMISIDGWIKIINRHPAFTGMSFNQSTEEKEGLPIWMECSIFRSDRSIPITVREYLTEVCNDSEHWKKLPRRMLRHKAMQQCARIALAVNVPDIQSEKNSRKNELVITSKSDFESREGQQQTQTEKLKSILN